MNTAKKKISLAKQNWSKIFAARKFLSLAHVQANEVGAGNYAIN